MSRASIGIAFFPQHGRTAEELLRRADVAMYIAKRTGSGHAVFDAAQEEETAQQLALLVDLRQCISRDELVLHYQPKIDLETHEVSGVEALVRWQHPERGLLMPASFMSEVERTELIEPVTKWVLNEALRQQRLAGTGHRPHDGGQHLRRAAWVREARFPTVCGS